MKERNCVCARASVCVCVDVDVEGHILIHAFMKCSAPLGHIPPHHLFFDSIACACLFPMENISTYCRPHSTVQADRRSICKAEFSDHLNKQLFFGAQKEK